MIVKIIEKSEITIPQDLIRKLDLKIGDNIDIDIQENKIIIKPVLIIPKSQANFWSKEWQQAENEVKDEEENVQVRKFIVNHDAYEQLGNW